MASSLQELITQLTETEGMNTQPTESLLAALDATQNSPYKFGDWAQQQGYTYEYSSANDIHKINNIELGSDVSSSLKEGYGTEQTYKNIIEKYNQMAADQQKVLQEAAQPTATQPTATTEAQTTPEEGEYVSPYQEQIQSLLDQLQNITPYQTPEELEQYLLNLLNSANQPFTYDPTQDAALKIAQQEAQRQVREGQGTKGVLYSSATISNIAKAEGALVPEYELKSYQRFADEKNRQIQMMTTLMQWDELQANRYYDQVQLIQTKFDYIMNLDQLGFEKFQVMLEQRQFQKEYELELQQLQLQQQIQDIEEQYKRVDALGYVDNKASVILGIDVGTKAQWVKELELQQQQEFERIKKEYENAKKLQTEQAKIDKALIAYKNSLEEATNKKLMQEQYKLDKKLLEEQHRLEMGGATGSGAGVVSVAKSNLGIKYVYGGTSVTKGMDCSAFTQYVMKQNGISIARTAADQAKGGTKVSWNNLQPGDLVFFNTISGNGKSVDHVGIYIGNGKMIHASSSNGKTIEVNMNTSYWKGIFTTAKRYTKTSRATSSGASSSSTGRNSSEYSTRAIQYALTKAGYSLDIDGSYGPATTAAVKAFQKKYGLTVDGNVGPKTQAKMESLKLFGTNY
jgi:cell wall-associated NlpC family hydrolase